MSVYSSKVTLKKSFLLEVRNHIWRKEFQILGGGNLKRISNSRLKESLKEIPWVDLQSLFILISLKQMKQFKMLSQETSRKTLVIHKSRKWREAARSMPVISLVYVISSDWIRTIISLNTGVSFIKHPLHSKKEKNQHLFNFLHNIML